MTNTPRQRALEQPTTLLPLPASADEIFAGLELHFGVRRDEIFSTCYLWYKGRGGDPNRPLQDYVEFEKGTLPLRFADYVVRAYECLVLGVP